MKLGRIALASFLGYAVGNNFGMLLGGSTIRFRLYTSWGLSAIEIVKLVFNLSATFWIGLFALSSVVFLVDPPTIPSRLHLPVTTTRPLGVVLGAFAGGYLVLCAVRRRPRRIWKCEFPLPPFTLSLMQYSVATLDLMVAAGVLYVLLPVSVDVSYFHLLAIYLLAIVAALITQVPGGLGVLELVTLVLLNPTNPHEVIAALLAYRLIYYLIPLVCGLFVLGGNEINVNIHHAQKVARVVTQGMRIIAPRLLAFTVFAAGVILVISGATPAAHGRMEMLSRCGINSPHSPFVTATTSTTSKAAAIQKQIRSRLDAQVPRVAWRIRATADTRELDDTHFRRLPQVDYSELMETADRSAAAQTPCTIDELPVVSRATQDVGSRLPQLHFPDELLPLTLLRAIDRRHGENSWAR